jgi:hypothetical protein
VSVAAEQQIGTVVADEHIVARARADHVVPLSAVGFDRRAKNLNLERSCP